MEGDGRGDYAGCWEGVDWVWVFCAGYGVWKVGLAGGGGGDDVY